MEYYFLMFYSGPGINDNGSGSATNLELALTLAKLKIELKNRIRFAWFGAEELGLLGSTYYVNDLVNNHPDELKNIAFNLNYDMLGMCSFYNFFLKKIILFVTLN